MSPTKHSFGKCDRRTDRRTDDGQSDPYVSLSFAGDTKTPKASENEMLLLRNGKFVIWKLKSSRLS